jgi:hypothetical protein
MNNIEFGPLALNYDEEDNDEEIQRFDTKLTIPQVNDPMDVDKPEEEQQPVFVPVPMSTEDQPFDVEEEMQQNPERNYNTYLKKTFLLSSDRYDPYVEIENKYKDAMNENKHLKQVIEEYKLEIGKLVTLRQKERASTAYYKKICEIIFSKLQSQAAKKCQECQ